MDQLTKKEIVEAVNHVYNQDFTKKWSNFFIKNISIGGLYYVNNRSNKDYTLKDVNDAQQILGKLKVYEIDHHSGSISLTEWRGNKYAPIKEITNNKDLFGV